MVSPYGDIVTKLSEKESAAANSVYSTIDIDLQRVAQQALGDFTGAVVVLERDTGRVLAMVSSPNFDPNDADINNPNSQWNAYFGQTDDPFFNRATQGQYPPGSIFKSSPPQLPSKVVNLPPNPAYIVIPNGTA